MKSLIVSLLLLVSSPSFGVEFSIISTSNEGAYGGGGVVCGSVPEIKTAQILDLWEAEAFKKMPVRWSDASVEEQLIEALNTYRVMNGAIPSEVEDTAWRLFGQVEERREGDIPLGLKIAPPLDMLSPFIPKPDSSCQFEGIAAYEDMAQVLFVDFLLYDLLSKTDRAALFFHEAIYKYLRDHYGVRNSINARNITACAFAAQTCPELSPMFGLPEEGPLYKCYPHGWRMAAKKNPAFNPDDRGMGQPEFMVFPAITAAGSPIHGYRTWRFQQINVDKDAVLVPSGVEKENLLAKSFFDVQVAALQDLDLSSDGRILSPVLSLKGNVDMVVSTLSSDSTDPWRKSVGPQFVYRLRPSLPLSTSGKTQLVMSGFPVVCDKVR